VCFAGGGGGSSYTTPSATSVVHTQGFQSGNGQILITYTCTPLTPSVSDTEVCEGETVTLSATSGVGGTITWDGGVTNGIAFTPPLGTTTYTATSDGAGDCGFSVDITVNALPTVDAGSDLEICEGETATLIPTGTATTYNWDGGVTTGLPFTPPAGTTTYTVTGEDLATGCQATDAVDVTLVVIDETVNVSGGVLTSNQTGASYQWIDCSDSTNIAGETSQSMTPPVGNGSYAVVVTIGGCSDTSACVDIVAGMSEEAPKHFSVMPNPSDGQVMVICSGEFSYTLTDLNGKILLTSNASNAVELDLSDWTKGVYLLTVIRDEVSGTLQLMIK
jgi:hypothetical protein